MWFDRWFQRLLRLLSILHEGFWLGWLDSEDLTAVTIRSYQQNSRCNSPEHNQSGLFPWERQCIDRFFRPSSKILVAASGGGREIIALHGLGFRADGFDCTPPLVENPRRLLQELGIPSNVLLCPPNEVPTELTPHDGLIIGWGGYTHIPGSARRIAFLRKLHALVPCEAPILLSFWGREETSPDTDKTLRLAKWFRSLRGQHAEPIELGDCVNNRGYHHSFSEAEIQAELKAGGFRMCHYSRADHAYCAVGVAE